MATRRRRSVVPTAPEPSEAEPPAPKRGPAGGETAAAKRRKSMAPAAAAAEAPRPLTRSQQSAAQVERTKKANQEAVLDAISFLEAETFQGAAHVRSLYRLPQGPPPSWPSAPVREKCDTSAAQFGADVVAQAVGFPSPYLVVNLGDRKGIWQADPPLVKQLGEDPRKRRREHVSLPGGTQTAVAPAGLKNLGATCYLNSLLQYLFFNVDFRQSLLSIPSNSKVVQALQQVFALLAKGQQNIVDPTEFVQAAGLDVVEQEDATEFSTLLLDWLERELGRGEGGAKGGGFIPVLFQGEVSQFLTCLEHPEHTFERREPFYELRVRLTPSDVPKEATAKPLESTRSRTLPPTVVGAAVGDAGTEVAVAGSASGQAAAAALSGSRPSAPPGKRGGKKKSAAPAMVQLEQLLADTAFPDEMLDGSNRYHCPKCDKKVDAMKSLRLARPPPYLHIIVERNHYDLQKGMRIKLNNPVSFPQRLQLRLCAPSSGAEAPTASSTSTVLPVMYECVGYLEHFSDSAHTGHYTATLYQEHEDMAEGLRLAEEASFPAPAVEGGGGRHECAATTQPAGPASQDERPSKRQCCDSADAAAGAPRRGTWWILDDSTVSPVAWQPSNAAAAQTSGEDAAKASRSSPRRIESSSAYLLLYRRSDHSPGQFARKAGSHGSGTTLPADLAEFVAAANKGLASEQDTFDARSAAVSRFLKERRQAVDGFVQALRSTATDAGGDRQAEEGHSESSAAANLSAVPTAWLNAFLRGEDRQIEDLAEGDMQVAPVMYGRMLVRAPGRRAGQPLLVDPLAVWCGGIKLVPTAALDACGARGGLDSSSFLDAQDSLSSPATGEAVWNLARLYLKEWMLLTQVLLEGKVSLADARALHQKGRGEDVVWISTRTQKLWQKAVGSASSSCAKSQPWQVMVMKAFLAEVQRARWAGQHDGSEDEEPEEPQEGDADSGNPAAAANDAESPAPGQPAGHPADRHEISLTAGIVCRHGLVCRPRAACLVRRADILQVLDNSNLKEQAYRALWPDTHSVPRLRTGLADGRLLAFGDTCSECRGDAGGGGCPAAEAASAQRRLVVRRRYPSSKITRKVGHLAVPDSDEPITGTVLRTLMQEQLELPVARVLVAANPEGGGAQEVELQDDDVLCDTLESIVVEKDETARDREASAFHGSVFRGGVAATT